MKRAWAVGPDPATGIVNRQELIEAIMDGEAILWRGGGVLSIVVGRRPTALEGEMVTTGAIIEWKDRTDARPQPERPVDIVEAPEPEPDLPGLSDEDFAELEAAGLDDVGDGLDPRTLEDEDVAAIPEHAR